jgi:hypothetical protein
MFERETNNYYNWDMFTHVHSFSIAIGCYRLFQTGSSTVQEFIDAWKWLAMGLSDSRANEVYPDGTLDWRSQCSYLQVQFRRCI